MSDLISRNKLLESFRKSYCGHLGMENSDGMITFRSICRIINEQPIAYDVGKVVEELEELRKIKEDYAKGMQTSYATFMYNKAIDDFAERLSKYLGVENATKYGNKNAGQQRNSYDTIMKYEIADAIDDVAEQLKAGRENED